MPDPVEPPYQRIAGALRERIRSGELAPGDRVPSTRAIVQEWGVAMVTAAKALGVLQQEGLVEAHPGMGTVVRAGEHTREPRRTGGRRQTLTRGRIVAAAIAIADAEGLDALSMRRLATALDVGPMTLYRHVAGKDELVYAMVRELMAAHPLPAAGPGPLAGRAGARLPAPVATSTAPTTGWPASCRRPGRCSSPRRWPTRSGCCAHSTDSGSRPRRSPERPSRCPRSCGGWRCRWPPRWRPNARPE